MFIARRKFEKLEEQITSALDKSEALVNFVLTSTPKYKIGETYGIYLITAVVVSANSYWDWKDGVKPHKRTYSCHYIYKVLNQESKHISEFSQSGLDYELRKKNTEVEPNI